MTVFLNGDFIPKEAAVVSILDRGFLYGDGVFETMRVVNGQPFRWWQHWERLEYGADFLKLRLPIPAGQLWKAAFRLIAVNRMPEAVLRLMVTRGIGPRGYSIRPSYKPCVAMTMHPAPKLDRQNPAAWKLRTASVRLPAGDILAKFKTCNKLAQIMARAEAEAQGADEALLLNTDGVVAETASSNLFWFEGDQLCLPPLAAGVLAGVTRQVVLQLGAQLNLRVQENSLPADQLKAATGVFLTQSVLGIIEIVELDGQRLRQSPWVPKLWQAYYDLMQQESALRFESRRPTSERNPKSEIRIPKAAGK